MILFLFWLGVIYWIALSLWCYSNIKKAFSKYRNALRIQTPQKYNAFMRMDFGKWNQEALLRRSYTVFPARVTGVISFVIIYAILMTIHRYIKFPSFILKLYRNLHGANSLRFCFDIVEQFDTSQQIDTPIIISNHSTWVDVYYFGTMLKSIVSFVAKKEVSKMPFISSCARFLQCILVERTSKDARNKVMDDIKDRVTNYERDPKNYFPICIFPEGTVSNGRSIMTFKNGAFECLSPITLFCLKYESKQFHMGDNEMTVLENFLMTFCAGAVLRVRKEKIVPKEKETVEEYRERCRFRIAEMWGYKVYDVDYKDYMEYEKMYKQKLGEINGKKAAEQVS